MEAAWQAPPPKRHRRRWLIAASVIGSIIAWSYWPRGVDQRLIGKWSIHRDSEAPPKFCYDFQPNGQGACYDPASTHRSEFVWHVSENRLITRSWHVILSRWIDDFVSVAWQDLTGVNLRIHEVRYDLLTVSANEIDMKSTETFLFGGGRQILRRISQ
jgi:hypothetical protein